MNFLLNKRISNKNNIYPNKHPNMLAKISEKLNMPIHVKNCEISNIKVNIKLNIKTIYFLLNNNV